MAESPSPYAPGIIADDRLPPRPAGRAVVFLVATFVMAIVTSELWQDWSSRAMIITGRSSAVQAVVLLGTIPGWLVLVWAYLSDAVPLWGSRREGYLMLTCLITAMAWLAIAVAHGHQIAWFVAAVPLGVASSMSRAVILGALTEIGRRRGATGPLAAVRNALLQLATLLSQPLLMWSAWAAFSSIWLVAGVAAGLALAVVGLTATLSDDGTAAPAPLPVPAPVTVSRFLRSRTLWAAFPLLICAGCAIVPHNLMILEIRETYGEHALGLLAQWQPPLAAIAAAGAYLVICRRSRFPTLITFAFLAKAAALAIVALAARGQAESALRVALVARAAGDSLAGIAILDLAMRAAPRGREAFGAILLVGVPSIIAAIVDAVSIQLSVPVESIAWFATGAALAAAIAVLLLPEEIRGRRDRPVLGSPP